MITIPSTDSADKMLARIAAKAEAIPSLKRAVSSAKDEAAAIDIVRQIKLVYALLEEEKEKVITPIRKALDYLYERQRAIRQPLEKREKELLKSLAAYSQRLLAKAEAKAEKEIAKRKVTDAEIVEDIQEAQVQAIEAPSGTRTRWEYVPVVESTEKIPAYFDGVELRPLHEPALRKLVASRKGDVTIPGVRIERVRKLSVR